VIGIGASVYDLARDRDLNAIALNGATKSSARDKSGTLGFVNARAEWYWKLREALDPASDEKLAIPPDAELRADLTAPRWSTRAEGIQVEPKPEIHKRIGRSPDRGDSLVYAFSDSAFGGAGLMGYYREQAAIAQKGRPGDEIVRMRAPAGMSAYYDRHGKKLTLDQNGMIDVPRTDAGALRTAGFTDA
jgi:hypothetical protein